MSLHLSGTLRERLASATRPLTGGWVCSGSPLLAEIMAGSGLDWVLIDLEHSPNSLPSTVTQLQAVAGTTALAAVRLPCDDPVVIKQVLDLGAQTIVVPMVETAAQAAAVVRASRYPPAGIRGIGAALARSSRWNRVEEYLAHAADHVCVVVQVESVAGVANAAEIAATDGVDGVLVGPSDLAASLGLLGQQQHPDVVAAVLRAMTEVIGAGCPVGVNAFAPDAARRYAAAGASFLLLGADIDLVARGSERLATLLSS